jgi:hypothetical protein
VLENDPAELDKKIQMKKIEEVEQLKKLENATGISKVISSFFKGVAGS